MNESISRLLADLVGPLPADRIGIQLFTIPKMLEKDFEGSLKKLAEIGYKQIEFYGPFPFSAPEAVERWNAVTPSLGFSGSGYFGKTIQEVKVLLDRYHLSTPSMHTDLTTLRNRMGALAEAAGILGQKYVVLPSGETQTTLDGYKKQADLFNEIGEKAKKEGIRFAYHNHGNGLHELEGTIPLQLLLERTDPELVFFEMDIYWTTAGGADPVAYFEKYTGRYRLMHIKDMSKAVKFSGDGGDSKQWIELFPYMTDPGSGVLDLKKILSAAQKSGMEYFLFERDMVANPDESLPASYKYLSGLNLA